MNNSIVALLGDSLEILESFSDKFNCIWTDPPYGINYQSMRRTASEKFTHIQGDSLGNWIGRFARICFERLEPNSHLYCCTRFDTYPDFFYALKQAGFTMKRTIIWVKNNHGSGDLTGDYAPRDEWIIFAHKGRREFTNGRRDNIFEFPKINSHALIHPTEKPVALIKECLQNSIMSGEWILDPFAGSFSTGLASIALGCNFVGIEKDPQFYTPALERLQQQQNIDLFTEI